MLTQNEKIIMSLSGDDGMTFGLSNSDSLEFVIASPTSFDIDIYNGAYAVTPSDVMQVLQTANKKMLYDVTVEAISAGATQHIIHFEFTDGTGMDIDVYYDDALIGTMITNYVPETYGTKTVNVAELDGVAWYTRPSETWETVYSSNVPYYPDEENTYPYCWISDLSDVLMPDASVWRVTFDQIEYRCTVVYDDVLRANMIGNPKYSGGQDNGSNAPFYLMYTPWGAWSGSADVDAYTYHQIKIERLVT